MQIDLSACFSFILLLRMLRLTIRRGGTLLRCFPSRRMAVATIKDHVPLIKFRARQSQEPSELIYSGIIMNSSIVMNLPIVFKFDCLEIR